MRRSSIVSVVVAILLGFAASSVPAVFAQDATTPPSVISVIGYGEARAPAESATIQIAIAEGNFGGPQLPQPGATPGARERESVSGVVAALVDAGVAEEDIEVFVGPAAASAGSYFGPARAILTFPLDTPDNARINEVVDASAVAAADEALIVGQVNAAFTVEDCEALVAAAREAAIGNARNQAETQAELLGVTIGDVTSSVDLPVTSETASTYYGPYAETSTCDEGGFSESAGLFEAPVYDPSMEPEVAAYSRIILTFGIEQSAEATPS